MNQETIALGIVGFTGGALTLSFLRAYLAPPLSRWLLKQGRAKIAFWVRKQAPLQTGSCSGCKSC
jgi:hypothetical protein